MSSTLACPDMERWHALLHGDCLTDLESAYAAHLEECPGCQALLDQMPTDDETRRIAQKFGDPTAVNEDPTIVQVLDRAYRTRYPSSISTPDLEALPFLRAKPGDDEAL